MNTLVADAPCHTFAVEPLQQRNGVLAVYACSVFEFRDVNLRQRGVARARKSSKIVL
jgi:hypothetical protein